MGQSLNIISIFVIRMISQETLQKYLDQEATIEERSSVDNWRGESLQNELQFQEFESYYLTGVLPDSVALPVEKVKFWRKWYIWFFLGILIISYSIAIVSSQRVFLKKTGGVDTLIQIESVGNIRLNKGSVLTYPEVFDGNYNKVFVEGGAYFHVFEDCESFIIESMGSRIKVIEFPSKLLITSFGKDSVQLIVEEGRVLWDIDKGITELDSGMSAMWNIKINQVHKDFNYQPND